MYIEESFDTIFNMGYVGGRTAPLPMGYGSGKSPMDERVKLFLCLMWGDKNNDILYYLILNILQTDMTRCDVTDNLME